MKKFINFCKKPLLIASCAIFFAFMVALIVVSCLPHGKTYTLEAKMGIASLKEEIVLKNNDTVEINVYINDELMTDMGAKGTYKIINKSLYVASDGSTEKIGKINAYTIDIDWAALMGEDVDAATLALLKDAKMTCKANVNFRTSAIVLMSFFGVVAVACGVVVVLDKKGIIKYKLEDVIDTEQTQTA